MKRLIAWGIVLAMGLMARPASAGIIRASGSWTSALDADGVNYDYSITLTNTAASTDVIGTFWFAWVPGGDFLDSSPISLTTPGNWVGNVTHGPPLPNGYAIQWVANTGSELAIGGSQTFGFKSAETPAQLLGNSSFFPTTPEGTSVAYNGKPFSADSQTFIVPAAAVPEPSTFALAGVLGVAGAAGGWLRRKRTA